jgi:hypothetical protein
MKQSVTKAVFLLLAGATILASASESQSGIVARKSQFTPEELENGRKLQSSYYTYYDSYYCQSYKNSYVYDGIVQNLYYSKITSSRSYTDVCDNVWGTGSSYSDNLTTDQKKIRMALAIAVPVAIFAVIMVCTACSCICCRPRN